MTLNLGRQYWKAFAAGLLLLASTNLFAAETELKPHILAVCQAALTAAPASEDSDTIQAWRQVQAYLAHFKDTMITEDMTKGSRELKAKRRAQQSALVAMNELSDGIRESQVRKAKVISGPEEILNFIRDEEEQEKAIQAELDNIRAPLTLNNYVRELATPASLRKMIWPTVATVFSVATTVWTVNSMVSPNPVYQTVLDMVITAAILRVSKNALIKMGKTIAGFGVPSLRAEWENASKTRTDVLQNYFEDISHRLNGTNGVPFAPKYISIRQPITKELYQHCDDLVAGKNTEEVIDGVTDSLRLANGFRFGWPMRWANRVLPKYNFFTVDMIFQHSDGHPTLTVIGRCQ